MRKPAKLVHVGIPRGVWRSLRIEAARKDRRLYEVLCERLGFAMGEKPNLRTGNPDRAGKRGEQVRKSSPGRLAGRAGV